MRPPTAHTGLPAEALRRRSPNAVAVFAAHAQASDRLMPKLRPLELSDTALEPRRAHGQRRRGASAQLWRGRSLCGRSARPVDFARFRHCARISPEQVQNTAVLKMDFAPLGEEVI